MSPLKNDLKACQQCHAETPEWLRNQIFAIQDRTMSRFIRAGYATATVAKLFEIANRSEAAAARFHNSNFPKNFFSARGSSRMKRMISVLARRHFHPRKLVRLPRRCRAPIRGIREPMSMRYAVWSLVSGMVGILAIAEVTTLVGRPLLIGSFGASAVLLFGANDSPLAQPRNLVGGHLVGAVVAVVVVALFGSSPLTIALGVGLAIFLMNLTHTTHPPGGATAVIGILGEARPDFILVPVLAGAAILLVTAIFTNNVVYHRFYPKHWL